MIVKTIVKKNEQPKGLKVFCFSIFFERYGFYLVQGLLILYLVKFFNVSDGLAYSVLGSFIALSYITPLIGGFIADKFWGLRRSIFIGALIECIGLILIIFPDKKFLYCGLTIFATGVGLLKPSASSLLGYLYSKNDSRQDAGYTIFYVVFNIGIILSTFISGYIVRYAGWQYAFSTAIIAIAMTYLVFYFGLSRYKLQILGPDVNITHWGNVRATLIVASTIIVGLLILLSEAISIVSLILTSIAVLSVFIYCIIKTEHEYKGKLIAFFMLLMISIVFWALYMQLFLSITLFIENLVDKNIFGLAIPTPSFVSIEAFGVVLFGYPLARFWVYLSETRYNPSLPMKFSISMILLSISIAILVFASQLKGTLVLVNPVWIIVAYLILAIAELALSPIGLSMVNKLVPEKFSSMMMGIFLLTTGLGGKVGGLLAGLAKVPENLSSHVELVKAIYSHAFDVYLVIAILCTLLSLVLVKQIKKKVGADSYL